MKKVFYLLAIITLPFFLSCSKDDGDGGGSGDGGETTPNQLSLLSAEELNSKTELTLTGNIDVRDFRMMKNLPNLKSVDLSKATIVSYKNNQANVLADSIFYNCPNLTTLKLPETATTWGGFALKGCDNLESVTLPSQMQTIPSFNSYKKLKSVDLPASITEIPASAFNGCSALTTVNIPASVTKIGESAFSGCTSLETITLPANLTEISNRLFQGCSSLKSITIPNSVTNIGYSAFANCTKLATVNFSQSLKVIGENGFSGCTSLTSVTIPASIERFGHSVFEYCTKLETVDIKGPISNFGNHPFYDCPLKALYINNPVPPPTTFVFTSVNTDLMTVYIPADAFPAYMATAWKNANLKKIP